MLSVLLLQTSCSFGEWCSWFPQRWWPSWKGKMTTAEEKGESNRRRHRASWKPTSCCSPSSRCPQSSPFVPCSSPLKYFTVPPWIFGLPLKFNLFAPWIKDVSLCFRWASLQQMQWQAWSWWRLEFPRSSWRCWQCPWCLYRSYYLWSSVNTQQGPDLSMSSTRPSLSGCDTHIQTQKTTHSLNELKADSCFAIAGCS